MTEENSTVKTTETTDGVQPVEQQPSAQQNQNVEEPKVPRSVLQQQGQEYKAKLDELQKQLQQYQSAEEKKKEEELRAANNFTAIEEQYKSKIAELENQYKSEAVNNRKQKIENHIIAAGLDPNNPKDKFTINGIISQYDGDSDPGDWFQKFSVENKAIFEKNTFRPASVNGAPPVGNSNQDTVDLVARFKRAESSAVAEVMKRSREGRLDESLAAQLGLPVNR